MYQPWLLFLDLWLIQKKQNAIFSSQEPEDVPAMRSSPDERLRFAGAAASADIAPLPFDGGNAGRAGLGRECAAAGRMSRLQRRWAYPLACCRSAGCNGISKDAAPGTGTADILCRRCLFGACPSADAAELRKYGDRVRQREQKRNEYDAQERHETDGIC